MPSRRIPSQGLTIVTFLLAAYSNPRNLSPLGLQRRNIVGVVTYVFLKSFPFTNHNDRTTTQLTRRPRFRRWGS